MICIISVSLSPFPPPSVKGRAESRRRTGRPLCFLLVSLSGARPLAFLLPELGNAHVQTPPPPGLHHCCVQVQQFAPSTRKGRGGVCTFAHSQIQEAGTQEDFLSLILHTYLQCVCAARVHAACYPARTRPSPGRCTPCRVSQFLVHQK